MKKINLQFIYKLINKYIFICAPIIALLLFFVLAKMNNLAPAGNDTIAWCDLNQQGIPLLNQFKDILEGKQSLNGNLEAGGMSYFGVFFFYIASPFSFLVLFVNKSDMQSFVNVIIMLKMATAAFTFSLYLKKKYNNLNLFINLALSIFYAFSGYVMMYYQTLTWLDMIYLFPILILSIDLLLDKGKMLPYIISITIIVSINYYIGVMIVFYIIFYFGLSLFYKQLKYKNKKDLAVKFIISSFIAVLLSMSILIPSLIDYFNSSRTISIVESLKIPGTLTPLETVIPIILGTIILFPFLFNKSKSEDKMIKLILLALLSIPLIIDPINKMWHYGSYQAFPCRFAFINIFLLLDIVALVLHKDKDVEVNKRNVISWIISLTISLGFIIFLFIFENKYVENNMSSLQKYTHYLWGDSNSIKALLGYYSMILSVIIIIWLLYALKKIPKMGLGIILLSLAILESAFSFKIYMVSASRTTDGYRSFYEIANLIKDDSYYNIKSNYKIANVNDLGGAGYNNFGHYTSLTPKGYMDGLKKMGYSSYWMEVGAYGGTILSDALLINKYTIYSGQQFGAKYSTDKYSILENKVFPLGIVTNNDLSKYEYLDVNDRANIQKNITTALFSDEDLITKYDYSELVNIKDNSNNNQIRFETKDSLNKITYYLKIDGRQRLYFEAFDKYTNDLYQSINDAISVKLNGYYKSLKYPTQSYSGFIDIGEFRNSEVRIDISLKRDINCSSFNVFGVDLDKLDYYINNINHANMKYNNGHFEGTYEVDEDSYMFLPIAYTDNIKVKINNQNVKTQRVFDGFTAIKLQKGMNNINISYEKKGLIPAIFIALIGLYALGFYYILKDMNKLDIIYENIRIKNISYYLVLSLTALLLFVIYILPMLIHIFL